MSFRDLVRFMRAELSRTESVTLDQDQLRVASRTPGLILDRNTGNEIAGKLTETFMVSELTDWKFSVESFLEIAPGGRMIYYVICARDIPAWERAQAHLQQRVKREHDADINATITIPHIHRR